MAGIAKKSAVRSGGKWGAELKAAFPGCAQTNISMRNWTTFHCLGSVAALVSPPDERTLAEVVKFLRSREIPWRMFGKGSNLLVKDGGYGGCLIELSKFNRIRMLRDEKETVRVRAEAGVPNGLLLQWCKERKLAGFGFAFGIPGSIGGGVRMNAGTPLGWFAEVVTGVEGITFEGERVEFDVTPEDFAYRDFPRGKGMIVTAAHFRFDRSDAATVDAEIAVARKKRANQPLDRPNFGSIFKNPPDKFAGKLIEKAGLKGLRIGDAQIAPGHANFIVNLGSARTGDVLELMQRAADAVRDKFGVTLEPEVHVIGEDA